jgi:antitoxin MazE
MARGCTLVMPMRDDDDERAKGDQGELRGLRRKLSRDELIRELRAFRGRLAVDFKFDRDEANSR